MKFKFSTLGMNEQDRIYLLLREYITNFNNEKSAKQSFHDSSLDERQQILFKFQNWLTVFCMKQKSMIGVIKIFSPVTAKSLNQKIESYRNYSKKMLTEAYWCKYKQEGLLGEALDKFTIELLEQQIEFGEIDELFVNQAYLVASDTLKHVGVQMAGKRNEENIALENIIKSQIDPIKETLNRVLGKNDYAQGILLESFAKDFYRNNGYTIIDSDPNTDKKYKTDFVATKNNEVIIAQVKKGHVSKQEVLSISKCGSELINKSYSSFQQKTIIVIAKSMPEGFSEVNEELRKTDGVNLSFLPISKVSKKLRRAGVEF